MARVKGQFFIVAAIVLCIMFFAGFPLASPLVKTSNDLPYIIDNIKKEFPYALNRGINESAPISELQNFTRYIGNITKEGLINFSSLWVFTQNHSTNLNVTVFSYYVNNTKVSITVSSTEQLTMSHDSANTVTFTGVGDTFNLTVVFDDINETIEMQKYKKNLFAFVKVQRQDNHVQETFTA